jgi:hypothetical protein
VWFSQYGRLWDGPWFLIGDGTVLVYTAGIMYLLDLPTTTIATGDTDGGLTLADR